jgi:transcriptional regulator with XRE-family HTH domain
MACRTDYNERRYDMTKAEIEQLKLRLAPERRNLRHLAEGAGISQNYLSRVLNNRAEPSVSIAFRLADCATRFTGWPYSPLDFIPTKETAHD